MKIYRVKAYFYNHYEDERTLEEKFFSTREKAEAWKEEKANFCYGYDTNEVDPAHPWRKPWFEDDEFEVM